MKTISLLCFAFAYYGTYAREVTDDEYLLLPPVFHLDNYERCLKQKNGLYCLGTFELTPESQPNRLYDIMKEYSRSKWVFNRTRIHRGYCVSSRCPSDERNSSLRFERCASEWARARLLRSTLKTLEYCHSVGNLRTANTLNSDYQAVKYVFYGFLLLNFIGTTYDFKTNGNNNRNSYLLHWSARANWQRLTVNYVDGDPRLSKLSSIQGVRILAFSVMLHMHVIVAYSRLYVINSSSLEQILRDSIGTMVANATTLVHVFVLISSFLTTYNLLIFSQKKNLGYKILPISIIKRIIRIAPLYVLVIGYAATWWGQGEGPLWPAIVGSESNVCRRKFWYQLLFISNLVEPNETCLMQTWFLAADMQLTIIVTTIVIILAKRKHRAFYVLIKMFVASCVIISLLAFIFEWRPVVQIATPENMRNMFHDEPSSSFTGASFTRLYLSTLSCLPAAFVGQAMAYLNLELQEKGFKGDDHKWLVNVSNLGLPLLYLWLTTGNYFRFVESPLLAAALVGFERLLCCSIMGLTLIGFLNCNSRLSKFFRWRGWQPMGRVSLAVMLVHWFAIMSAIVRPNTSHASAHSIFVDSVTAFFLTYLAAVPLTVLVELPMQKTLDSIVNKFL